MKKSLFTGVLLSLVLIASAVSVSAQSDHSVVARIPFAFSIQQEQFPAGVYEVETLQHGYVRLHSGNGQSMIAHVVPNYSRSNRTAKGKLTFARYGSEYFLKQVWIPSSDFGMNLQSSTREKKIARNLDRDEAQIALQGR